MVEIKKSQINLCLEYFLLIAIIALSGFEYFYRATDLLYFILFPFSAILFFTKKKYGMTKQFLIVLLSFFVWGSLCIVENKMSTLNFIYFIIRFFTYFFIASIICRKFVSMYINIMYVLCFISLAFYSLINISEGFYSILLSMSSGIKALNISAEFISTNPSNTIILFTIPHENIIRNSGPFWEPGMFAVFINIALVINLFSGSKVFTRKNIIFLLASISTLSTTSIIATLFIFVCYNLIVRRSVKTIIFILALSFAIIPIYESAIISGKFRTNMENIDKSWSRFGAAILHFRQIEEHPILGVGLIQDREVLNAFVAPNGLTNIIACYGIPLASMFYILLFYFAFGISGFTDNKRLDRRFSWVLFIVLLIVAFSQDITTRHFYYLLMMLPLTSFSINQHRLNADK